MPWPNSTEVCFESSLKYLELIMFNEDMVWTIGLCGGFIDCHKILGHKGWVLISLVTL